MSNGTTIENDGSITTNDATTPEDEGVLLEDFIPNQAPAHLRPKKISPDSYSTTNFANKVIVSFDLSYPKIKMWCDSTQCGGERFFSPTGSVPKMGVNKIEYSNVYYNCNNCMGSIKCYFLRFQTFKTNVYISKIGEYPPFRPHVPTKVIALLGKEIDLFTKGRSCENQSLGIGAFSYYRQMVEGSKDKLINEIIKVAVLENAPDKTIQLLEGAKKETQFTKAIESIKTLIPESLKVQDQNLLLLLHTALSKGLHAKTDEECLSIAKSIRIVLIELSNRLAALKAEHKDLRLAIANLNKA